MGDICPPRKARAKEERDDTTDLHGIRKLSAKGADGGQQIPREVDRTTDILAGYAGFIGRRVAGDGGEWLDRAFMNCLDVATIKMRHLDLVKRT